MYIYCFGRVDRLFGSNVLFLFPQFHVCLFKGEYVSEGVAEKLAVGGVGGEIDMYFVAGVRRMNEGITYFVTFNN